MVGLMKRASKRMLWIERLWKIRPLNNEELSYVTYFDSVFFFNIGEYNRVEVNMIKPKMGDNI